MQRPISAEEMPKLVEAQVAAAQIPDYLEWIHHMRSTYNFSLVVRMSQFVGFRVPSKQFYIRMRNSGKELLHGSASTGKACFKACVQKDAVNALNLDSSRNLSL